MRYQRTRFLWAIWMAIAAAGPAAAQSPMPGIFGVYNPSTGQFQPVPPVQLSAPASVDSVAPAAVVDRSGLIRFRFNITIESDSPPATLPICYVNVYHSPPGRSYSESNSITGTRSGDTGACIVRVPYRWKEADTAYPVTMSVTVYVGNRSAGRNLPAINLPDNGKTTLITVPIVI